MATATATVVTVRCGFTTREKVRLTAFDLACRGRALPLLWEFEGVALDEATLESSLSEALRDYPILSGRYDGMNHVLLCDAGVELSFAKGVSRAEVHDDVNGSVFKSNHLDGLLPEKQGMDPDTCSAEAPLFKAKVCVRMQGVYNDRSAAAAWHLRSRWRVAVYVCVGQILQRCRVEQY